MSKIARLTRESRGTAKSTRAVPEVGFGTGRLSSKLVIFSPAVAPIGPNVMCVWPLVVLRRYQYVVPLSTLRSTATLTPFSVRCSTGTAAHAPFSCPERSTCTAPTRPGSLNSQRSSMPAATGATVNWLSTVGVATSMIANAASLRSEPAFPAASCATTLSQQSLLAGMVAVHGYEPLFATPDASVSNGPAGPLRDSSRSTMVTATLSPAVQVRFAEVLLMIASPPFG